MSLPDKTTILIVGAGPAGLATALSLLCHGFRDFIIVDAIPRGENSSRAVVIHSATLEALDTIGCGDDIVSHGVKDTTFNIGSRSADLCSPNIKSLRPFTRHPYVLVIPQNITERTLERKLVSLGATVYRPFKVVELRRHLDDAHLSDITFEDGRVISAKYVIGADGARSVIRSMAGIGFSDPTYTEEEAQNNLAQMVLADVTFEDVDADKFSMGVTLSRDSLFFSFPLPSSFNESLAADGQISTSKKIYRIGCGVPLAEGEIPHDASKEYIQNIVNRFGPRLLSSDSSVNSSSKPTRIKDLIWRSRFRNYACIADTTFTRLRSREPGEGGIILLIGDAAHIHSPAGGQGMNLSMRDAVFLGEAVTKHIHTSETKPICEADAILHEFATVRHAHALEVIKFTKAILSVSGMKYKRWMAWWCPINSMAVRNWGLWLIGNIPFVRDKMTWELNGLSRKWEN